LVPHSGGRSHLASYSERSVLRFGLPEILLSYIDCTYKVSVSLVYSCCLVAFRLFVFLDFVLAAKFVLIAVPADLDTLWFSVRGPVDQYRITASTVREAEYAVITELDCTAFHWTLKYRFCL